MMHLRHFYSPFRRLSTSRLLLRPALSPEYKSKNLWEERFHCDLLSNDQSIVKTINSKILSALDLNDLEVDVYINIAAPREKETTQLCEAAKTLAKFRKSLIAHTLLPSTSHAICRLFLDSGQLRSLVRLLEQRVEYGVFPDSFSLNILFDQALEQKNLVLASRLAALIMLQEEFGLDDLNDNFALYSVARYIESKTDFQDWITMTQAPDPVLEPENYEKHLAEANKAVEESEKNKDDEDDEEDEEDAEYIRIPFLRNPYNDKHFDLTHPREICGKTLTMLGLHLRSSPKESDLGAKCQALGSILLADWSTTVEHLSKLNLKKVGLDQSFKDAATFYIENLHDLEGPSDESKNSIFTILNKVPLEKTSLSQQAERRHDALKASEQDHIARLRQDIKHWSELRHTSKRSKDALEEKLKLIEEIKAKKEELKVREQYLYFYDNLKQKNLTRIGYD